MTANRRHWLERSTVQDEHWDQSPWPAQMVQPYDSDIEEEDDFEHRRSSRRTSARARKAADKSMHKSQSAPLPTLTTKVSSERPSSVRSISHRQTASKSEGPSSSAPSRRRHVRTVSVPEPAAQKLHIETILPLQLPPPNLCTLSPLSTYPTAWWSTSNDSLRRSESTNSFLSASSNGSWHGDHGDQDPDGQLERAISQLSISDTKSTGKQKTKDGLILSTYDYDYEDENFPSPPTAHTQLEIDIDDIEAEAIRLHAGPLISSVASFFLDVKSLALSYYISEASSSSSNMTTSQHGVLTRSQSDRTLYGNTTSTNDLARESNMLHQHRRQRAETLPTRSARDLEGEACPSSSFQKLWQWFLPTVDDDLERELLGRPRQSHHESRPRLDSVPSLYSDNSDTERGGSDYDDDDNDNLITSDTLHDHRQMNTEHEPLYDYTLKGRRDSVSKTYFKRSSLSVINTDGSPSPLWDNRWAEEPYQRSWSSVLNLAAL